MGGLKYTSHFSQLTDFLSATKNRQTWQPDGFSGEEVLRRDIMRDNNIAMYLRRSRGGWFG
jgi:hypothetical protein